MSETSAQVPSSPATTATAPAAAAPSVGDPAPLGLAAFAMTTAVLSVFNAGLIKESSLIVLPLAAFYGGLAQLLAGMWEFRRNNTFGGLAFSSYGAFWLAFYGISKWGTGPGDTHEALGLFLICWALFTAYMTIASLRVSGAVIAVFALLTLTFLLLAIGAFQNGTPSPDSVTKIGGYVGIVTALAAWYASFAGVTNSTFKRAVIPVWPRA